MKKKRCNRSSVFAVAICLVLLGPALVLFAQNCFGLSLPSWFSAEDASYLSGDLARSEIEGRDIVYAFATGELQEQAEEVIGGCVPIKAGALLGQAAIQREAIELSNLLFQWECYPTYYGSRYVYLPQYEALASFPVGNAGTMKEKWMRFADQLVRYANEHPETRFIVDPIGNYDDERWNPIYDLSNASYSSIDECLIILKEEFKNTENILVVGDWQADPKSYYQNFFRGDNHWSVVGAEDHCRALALSLRLPDVNFGETHFLDRLYIGSASRSGLMIVRDEFPMMSEASLESLELIKDDKKCQFLSALVQERVGALSASPFEDLYGACYGLSSGDSTLATEAGGLSNSRTAVLIGDSFRLALQAPLALHYDELSVYNHLSGSYSGGLRLEELMGGDDADDVYFCANIRDLADLLDRCPNYFESKGD